MKCSWCQKEIIRNLTMKEILWPFLLTEDRCALCSASLAPLAGACCPTCNKAGEADICRECRQWQALYPEYQFKHRAFFHYNEAFQEWIHQYKFLGDYRLRKTFVPELIAFFKQHPDYLVCGIPLSQARYQTRGFNQVDALLEATGVATTVLLMKTEDTAPQAGKNRVERLAAAQPFQATEAGKQIQGRKVLLVDDVYTTGRTLFHAAEILLPYQPAALQTLSLAR